MNCIFVFYLIVIIIQECDSFVEIGDFTVVHRR